jgi:phage shock protein A
MFARLIRYLKGLFGVGLDKMEDPEILLAQAQQEMKENQAKNRERAVQAITQKNNLQAEVDKTQKMVNILQAKAELALKNGDRDLARQLLVEKGQYDSTLTTMSGSLQSAQETIETIKTAMRREEERIRAKTAQAMALKTQWKQSQIEISINKAMEGMTTDGTDQAFERAQNKISSARSESAARTELAKDSLNGKLAGLDDMQANSAADDELAKLEQKMGLAPAPTTTTPKTPTTTSDIDKQLQELEARVGGGNGSSPS